MRRKRGRTKLGHQCIGASGGGWEESECGRGGGGESAVRLEGRSTAPGMSAYRRLLQRAVPAVTGGCGVHDGVNPE